MISSRHKRLAIIGAFGISLAGSAVAGDGDRLVAAMLGETPMIDNLRELTDTIGGRVTGSPANSAAVAWALEQFAEAGVAARAEQFEMPYQWREIGVSGRVDGDVSFEPSLVARPFSSATDGSLSAPLRDAGTGSEEDFARLGDQARGAWLLVETPELNDDIGLAGLFGEYDTNAAVMPRAIAAGAAGVVFMSTRPQKLMYRLPNFPRRFTLPVVSMDRENADRATRLLRAGRQLTLGAEVDVDDGYDHEPSNVIAEIRGSIRPEEIVLIGAHLDSHDLGTGALDNGSNVSMMIDIARQITRLELEPERTIRFALWNGEEQGLLGSWRYTEQHEHELDSHVMAASFDIGTGQILGFFTGGRPGMPALVDDALQPVAGLGPFHQVDIPLVGTDNFDFMIEGVPNLIAMQADANYASNYHAASDTFDKVDRQQLKLNSAIAAALVWGFANSDQRLPRQTHEEIEALINGTDLETQMRNFGVWDGWASGERGRHD